MSGEVVSVRLPSELAARLAERASSEMRTRSNLAAWLLAKGLEDPADEPVEPGVW
jgi:hypothetical protein